MKKRTFLAAILGVLLMSFAAYAAPAPTLYTTYVDPGDVTNSVFVAHPDNMTTSKFYITPNMEGYTLYVEANSTHNPYYESFSGYATEVYSNNNYGLIFHFVPDDTSGLRVDMYVAWNSYESIDFPTIIASDDYIDYLVEGSYSYLEMLSQ